MDIHEINSSLVSLDQGLRITGSQRENSSSRSDIAPISGADDASVIRKAGELAGKVLQIEDSRELRIDLEALDTPENILLAAQSMLKYGV
jgi:hypothetical protein